MAFKARVYLQRPGNTDAESVTPTDRDRTGAIPAVYVVQKT